MGLAELYKKYHQQVQFLNIYIREAHPVDGWWLGKGVFGLLLKMSKSKAATDVYDPTTLEERRHVAGDCEDSLQYGIHTFVDEMDDHVNQAYAAWPTRLYLVGIDGLVNYAGGLGPWDFHPSKLESAIEEYLAELETA